MPPDPLAKGTFDAEDSISQKILSRFKALWGLGSLCRIQTKWPFHKTLTRFWTANSVNVVINAIKHNTSDLEVLARVASAKGKRKEGGGGGGREERKTEGDWGGGKGRELPVFLSLPPLPPSPFPIPFCAFYAGFELRIILMEKKNWKSLFED